MFLFLFYFGLESGAHTATGTHTPKKDCNYKLQFVTPAILLFFSANAFPFVYGMIGFCRYFGDRGREGVLTHKGLLNSLVLLT